MAAQAKSATAKKGPVKYGLQWPAEFRVGGRPQPIDSLIIEMEMIRRGGQWTDPRNGKLYGNGLSFHYEQMRKLLWPHLDDHRWHRLCRDEILKNKITVIMGPASSAKTHSAAWISLCEYFCFPNDTLVLVSSTDMRGLRLRVWGEIADLWQQAKDLYPYLAGHLLDSRVSITTDALEDKEVDEGRRVRDMRKGIVGVPTVQGNKNVGLGKWCFPAGQLVDTPMGPIAIESINVGDLVLSAVGYNRVVGTISRFASSLVRVHLAYGKTIDCTPEHPFLTTLGWVNASCLTRSHCVVSPHESMSCVWSEVDRRQKEKVLLETMSTGVLEEALQTVQPDICPNRTADSVLFSELWREMENVPTANSNQNASLQGLCFDRQVDKRWNTEKQKGDETTARQCFSLYPRSNQLVETLQLEIPNGGRRNPFSCVSTSGSQFEVKNWAIIQKTLSAGVSHRRGVPHGKACDRNRWQESQALPTENQRRIEGPMVVGTRVERVEILKCRGDSRYSESEGGYRVYDLQVEGHPSFSVNGVVVHNCGIKQKRVRLVGDEFQLMGPSMLSAFSNLNKNVDFKAVILGNPDDTSDPLGLAAEPLDGWGTQMDCQKTTVWDTRFMGGRCVNLIGTDSPNFDQETKNKFPYLINDQKIKETLSFFPKDSPEYYSQCIGSMKIALMARRVITRQMCRDGHALDLPVWLNQERIRIASLDAAYGGDRCMFGWGEFGMDITNHQILCVYTPEVVPIVVGGEEAEMQIARWIKHKCEDNRIDPENFFHDSTGRGALGTALARVWSASCNPVEFGGRPTNRPVSLDMFIEDEETGVKRLKLSIEHYFNFVTELWFASRYAIEASQIRNLSEEVMAEGCKRQWEYVSRGGAKVRQVEPKEDMKMRTRQSPDCYDQFVILVEGARRRGFQIAKMAKEVDNQENGDWITEESEEQERIIKGALLQHA